MRRLAWFTAGFAGVCLLCCYAPAGSYRWSAAGLGVLFYFVLALWLVLRGRAEGKLFPCVRRVLTLCLGGVIASGWFWGWTALFRAPAEALVGENRSLTGTVCSYPVGTSIGGSSLTVSLDGGIAAPDLRLYATAEWLELQPGDKVSFTADLTEATRLRGEDTTYYTAKGTFLLGNCKEPPVWVEHPDHLPLRFWPTWCAEAMKQSLNAALDETAAPLAVALTTGDKSGMSDGLSCCLSRTGTSHALVVSGMHVSSLIMVFLFLSRNRKRLAILALPLLLFYALMAGGTPSALRSVVMQGVLLLAPFARREYDAPTSLAFALLFLLVLNPYAAGSVSLQLSFTAVAGLLLATPPLYARWRRPIKAFRRNHTGAGWRVLAKLWNFAAASLAASLGALLFSQPVLAFYFGQASLIFPVANILILAVVQALLLTSLLVGTLGIFLPGPAWVLGRAVGLLAHYIVWVVSTLGRLRFAALDLESPFFALCLIAVYLFLLAGLLLRGEPLRPVVPLVCLAALLVTALGLHLLPVATSLVTITALDVGQGSSTAFLSGGKACLVDCGGNQSDSAGDIAADYFASLGRARLDCLVLTHFDSDHINGLPRLFDRMEIQTLVIPSGEPDGPPEDLLALAQAEGTRVTYVTELTQIELGNARLTLYPPLSGGTSNESGLFALCTAGTFDALITGDADSFVEKMLVKYDDLPDIEFLAVGHHGSAGSTSAELLDAVLPELACISVGWNSYGHPDPETLERLAARDIPVFRTDEMGTVSFYVTENASPEGGYIVQADAG